MKMPAKMKAKWLKALRSGEYKQTKGTLYNPKTCGFCCLGVLQHVVSKGQVESDEEHEHGDTGYANEPSPQWYEDNGIKVNHEAGCTYVSDPSVIALVEMNDGKFDMATRKNGRPKRFATIANWIEKNVETY